MNVIIDDQCLGKAGKEWQTKHQSEGEKEEWDGGSDTEVEGEAEHGIKSDEEDEVPKMSMGVNGGLEWMKGEGGEGRE